MAKKTNTDENLPSNYDQELAEFALKQAARVKITASGRYISTRGKKMKYQGQEIETPFNGVVLDFRYENAYYTEAYDPENPGPPACFAVGEDSDSLIPDATSPRMQGGPSPDEKVGNPTCAACWANQFGSADRGRGKACKNAARVAIEPEDLSVEEPPLLRVSPTGLKGFNTYVKSVNERMKLPTFAVVTSIGLERDADFPVATFAKPNATLPKDQIRKAQKLFEEVQDVLMAPYDVTGFQENGKRAKSNRRPVQRAGGNGASAADNRRMAKDADGGKPKARPFGAKR